MSTGPIMRCIMCEDEPFMAPYDSIGTVLMDQHLRSEHSVDWNGAVFPWAAGWADHPEQVTS